MSIRFFQSIVRALPSTSSCFKSAQKEETFEGSITPGEAIFNTKAEFVQLMISQPLHAKSEITLRNGNEDNCLWLHQTFCLLAIGITRRDFYILQFESCCIDERFFVFLRSNFADEGDAIKLYLNGACSFTTSSGIGGRRRDDRLTARVHGD